jgi:hypothetical protein
MQTNNQIRFSLNCPVCFFNDYLLIEYKNNSAFSLGSFLSSICSRSADKSDPENNRYALYRNTDETAPEIAWVDAHGMGVRKTCRNQSAQPSPKALACLFQRRRKCQMRPMPVVQVHNKKEAQCTP